MKKNNNEITLKPINTKSAMIYIEGDGDLVLNKMNNRNARFLLSDDRGKDIAEVPNVWEDITTAISLERRSACERYVS